MRKCQHTTITHPLNCRWSFMAVLAKSSVNGTEESTRRPAPAIIVIANTFVCFYYFLFHTLTSEEARLIVPISLYANKSIFRHYSYTYTHKVYPKYSVCFSLDIPVKETAYTLHKIYETLLIDRSYFPLLLYY